MAAGIEATVVVVGAGPAGCAAAITLADQGIDVAIVDKATFPRDKFCGDGLTSGCLRHLDSLGLDPATVASWITVDDVHLTTPSGRLIDFPLPKGRGTFAAIATRLDLDNALVELARSRGVQVHEGHGIESIELRSDAVTGATSAGSALRADYLIAADGMWSPTRKLLGLSHKGYRGEWHAFRQYFDNVGPRAASELHVWFEPDILPGYVWSFPLADGRANIGFGVLRGSYPTGEMGRLWPALLDRPHIREIVGPDATPSAPHRAWPIPARLGEVELTAPRTFFVGDAAAACDPMTGEGIGQALETGIAAATAIIEAPDAEGARAAYESEINANLGRDMRFAAVLGGVLASEAGAEYSLRMAGASAWTRRNFARWLFEDYPRAVLGTPHRWHRKVFSMPGSYR